MGMECKEWFWAQIGGRFMHKVKRPDNRNKWKRSLEREYVSVRERRFELLE